MSDRTPAPDTPEQRARQSAFARGFSILVALVMIALMVVVAKAAQYAAVDAFGGQLGFNLASLVGVSPVIAFYFFLWVRYPHLNKVGLTRG